MHRPPFILLATRSGADLKGAAHPAPEITNGRLEKKIAVAETAISNERGLALAFRPWVAALESAARLGGHLKTGKEPWPGGEVTSGAQVLSLRVLGAIPRERLKISLKRIGLQRRRPNARSGLTLVSPTKA